MMMPMDALTEYEITIQSAERRVFHLLHSIEWQIHTERKTSCLWKMKCNITEDTIFRYEGVISGKNPGEVAAFIHPEGVYRAKWDSQSAGTSVVAKIGEKTSIIRHDTKPRLLGLISARDTVDLCRFETDEHTGKRGQIKEHLPGTRHVVLVSVNHPSAPIRTGIVRAHTHPTLVMIEPSGDGSKITAILHGEMNLMGVPTTIKDTFLPKGILNFFDDLSFFASKDVKVNYNTKLTGWM